MLVQPLKESKMNVLDMSSNGAIVDGNYVSQETYKRYLDSLGLVLGFHRRSLLAVCVMNERENIFRLEDLDRILTNPNETFENDFF